MIAVVFFFAFILAIGGGYGAVTGFDIVLNERGWTQVIASSVFATGGMILFGIGTVLLALRRIEHRAFRIDGVEPAVPLINEAAENAPAATETSAETLNAPSSDTVILSERTGDRSDNDGSDAVEPAPAPPREVVGTYAAGGITYFMFSDSSIEAEMEIGRYRFVDMDELRGFIETGKGGEIVAAKTAR